MNICQKKETACPQISQVHNSSMAEKRGREGEDDDGTGERKLNAILHIHFSSLGKTFSK